MIDEKPTAAIVLAPGARAAEAQLLDEVGARVERRDAAIQQALASGDAPAAAALLARPLRIVVPSRPLRDQVSAALLRRFGRSLGAVVVHTQWALALAVVERADAMPPGGEELFRVLVQRFAADEPVLCESLGALQEGYGIALATARDLLDAGLAAGSADAADEVLAELATPEAERARAVLRITTRALAALEAEGRAPRGALLQRACETLRARGDDALPTAALWVHGFADATGIVGDWIEALQRTFRARVVVGVPPDPFGASESESEFSKRFLERVVAGGGDLTRAEPRAAPSLALLRAPGAFAEVRAVALRIRALLDDGVAPESIGVVARALDPYRAALGAHFARLAIPFSAPGTAASADLRARRLAAAAQLIVRAERTTVDTWLAASLHPDSFDGDLRVGLHVLGAAHLEDLAQLDLARVFAERDFVQLPVRRGSVEEERADDEGEAAHRIRRVRSRSLARRRLEDVQARAGVLVARLAAWPVRAAFGAHAALLEALLGSDLGWTARDASLAPALAALQALGDEVPATFALDRAEFAALVTRALEGGPGTAVGGAGAGIQVLPVMGARGLCFEHLFVLGLNREVFPRTPNEDPLVPDVVRRALRTVLPELPVKGEGRSEERHLFAELLSSSPRVTLSWQYVSDEGREVARSGFVERLCLVQRALEVATAPSELAGEDALRPAHEHAVRAALHGSRAALVPIRGAALGEVRAMLGTVEPVDVAALARLQSAILDEIDPDPRTPVGRACRARLGPYFGYVGAASPAEINTPIYVTRLEAIARCPWQAFLRNGLGLAPAPDALDALPALSPLVVGNALHALLQVVVERALDGKSGEAESLAAALARGAVRVPWPEAAELESIALQAAARVAAGEGVRIPGFARALAERALGMAAVAHALDWSDPGGLPVLGAEVLGEVAVADAAGRARRVAFRVDRVDLVDGVLCLTDYKTGNPVSDRKKPETRRAHLLEAVKRGTALQGVAYLAGALAHGAVHAQGRLLYLREDLDDDLRAFVAEPGDTDLLAAFEATARAVFAANDAGTLFPRLVLADEDAEPRACDWCEVSAACLRGESGQRARLRRWVDADARGDGDSVAERALFSVFAIGREPEPRTGESP